MEKVEDPPRVTTQFLLFCQCSCPPAPAVAHVETRKFVSSFLNFERALLLCLQNATIPSDRLALNDASAEHEQITDPPSESEMRLKLLLNG